MKLKSMFLAFIGSTLLFPAIAGHVVGNGGDLVRANFLQFGGAVIQFLETTNSGKYLVAEKNIDLARLKESLNIEKVTVTENTLTDNGGSVVEAIGEPGKILLNKFAWFENFERERDVYFLVFHEMLREVGVNDDNYTISQSLRPFPKHLRVSTRISEFIPLIHDDILESILDQDAIVTGGTGCEKGSARIEFDQEKNIAQVGFSSYRLDSDGHNLERKACTVALPLRVPAGKRVKVSLLDANLVMNLTQGARAYVKTESYLSGSAQPVAIRRFTTTDEALQGRALIRRTEVLSSECGKSAVVNVATALRLDPHEKATNQNDLLQIQDLRLYLTLENCE